MKISQASLHIPSHMQSQKNSSRREVRALGIIIDILENCVPKYMISPSEKSKPFVTGSWLNGNYKIFAKRTQGTMKNLDAQ
jgi:hypothetical protein